MIRKFKALKDRSVHMMPEISIKKFTPNHTHTHKHTHTHTHTHTPNHELHMRPHLPIFYHYDTLLYRILCFVDRASLYNLFQIKPTRCTLLPSYIYFNFCLICSRPDSHPFIHSLVFSLRGRVGRNQSPVM